MVQSETYSEHFGIGFLVGLQICSCGFDEPHVGVFLYSYRHLILYLKFSVRIRCSIIGHVG